MEQTITAPRLAGMSDAPMTIEDLWQTEACEQQIYGGETRMREEGAMVLPIGPAVHFEVIEYDFDQLTQMLVDLERRHSRSTLEVFRDYLEGRLDDEDEDQRDWFTTFLLYLGTEEVCRWSCP